MKINKKIIVAMCLVSILSVGCGSISEENKPNERYENVKKEDLTYDTEKDDSKDNEKEVITEVYSADSIKNDINYKKILQGFSYASESNPCESGNRIGKKTSSRGYKAG